MLLPKFLSLKKLSRKYRSIFGLKIGPATGVTLNVLAKIDEIGKSNFMIQVSKSQKRDFRHFSGAKLCYSKRNVIFENFMYVEWSEEKFLKGIVGDKRRLHF